MWQSSVTGPCPCQSPMRWSPVLCPCPCLSPCPCPIPCLCLCPGPFLHMCPCPCQRLTGQYSWSCPGQPVKCLKGCFRFYHEPSQHVQNLQVSQCLNFLQLLVTWPLPGSVAVLATLMGSLAPQFHRISHDTANTRLQFPVPLANPHSLWIIHIPAPVTDHTKDYKWMFFALTLCEALGSIMLSMT